MPSTEEILRGVRAIAERAMPVAFFWHAVIAAALLALLSGAWRPTRRAAAVALSLPLFSVSALAWATPNPFNGSVFAVAAALLAVLGARLDAERVAPGPAWAVALGAASIAFGWVYPHFLDGRSPLLYLVAAPTGIIPCPTLAVVAGFTLLAGGFASRAWTLTLGVLTLFYALFGMFRLHVWLDAGLLAGAVGLVACAARTADRERIAHHATA